MWRNKPITLSTVMVFMLLISASVYSDDVSATNKAYIVSPDDGATVTSPVTVIFGLSPPYGVAPAGVAMDNTGHHHLLIDTNLPNLEMPIPKDHNHRHFGGGQTEVSIELPPGEHTLQLLLGDFKHMPHSSPIVSEQITITVE